MCDPATSTLTYLSIASTVAGGFLQMAGQQAAGAQQANSLRYQADVDRNNAILADRQAADAIDRGKNDEMMHRIKIGQLKGTQLNAFAKNGVTLDSGSPLDVLSDTAQVGELEALTIRNNAEREASGYRQGAQNYRSSAQNNLIGAKNAKSSATTSVFTTALGTAGTVANRWYDYKNSGAFA